MRTTVELDSDVARAVEELRRDHGRGVSEAVNELIRRGLVAEKPVDPYVPRPRRLGIKIDVTSIANALEALDGPGAR